MPSPYLIAHLVRNTPAFDIAIRCDDMGTESDPGPWWIIPTSGHRAYPYWELPIHFYNDSASKPGWGASFYLDQGPNQPAAHWNLPDCPDDHPDHYTTYAAPRQGLITNLAERLGFIPKPTITRR